MSDPLLLITSCIYPSADQTRLTDPGQRFEYLREALQRTVQCLPSATVVIVDGSAHTSPEAELHKVMHQLDVPSYEVLHAPNDASKVRCQGKGYGEGEMIKRALVESRLMRSSSRFVKISAKYYCTNVPQLLRAAGNRSYFYRSPLHRRVADTRIYIANRDFYESRLLDVHQNVFDSKGVYLEHVVGEAIVRHQQHIVGWPPPIIYGWSGSEDKRIAPSLFRRLCARAMHLRGLFW